MKPSLKRFADEAGVDVFLCGPGWGGRYGYRTADYPMCASCGFKTKREARRGWAIETFGEKSAVALFSLLGEDQ